MRNNETAAIEKYPIYGSSLAYWYARENGRIILHITGEGGMPKYGTWVEEASPWYGFHEAIIDQGVTSVGAYAFFGCADLEKVELPSTLRSIGPHCFEGCLKLKSLRWPMPMSMVESGACKDCSSQKQVILPEEIVRIDDWAFQNCGMLQQVSLPSSIGYISATAFWGVELACLDVSACGYEVEGGCLYHGNRLVTASGRNENIEIRPGTTVVSKRSFYRNTSVRKVYCPSTVKEIEEEAFAYCVNLRKIYCENQNIRIGDRAFEGCAASFSYIPETTCRLTMDTGRIATTRYGYAVLKNGRVSFSPSFTGRMTGCVDGDCTPLMRYADFIDIQGGFDFVIGLRENGMVVATTQPSRETDPHSFSPADIGDVTFPNNVSFSKGMKQIAAAEGRVAGIDRNGKLFHCQADTFEQPVIRPLPETAKSVSVGYDTLLYIDQDDRIKLMSDTNGWAQDLQRNLCQKIHESGEIPEQCKIYNPYYCNPTVAVLTEKKKLFWCGYIDREPLIFPYPVKRFAIGSSILAAIVDLGSVFIQFAQGDCVKVLAHDTAAAVDVGIIHREKLIVLYDTGKDVVFDLEQFSFGPEDRQLQEIHDRQM